MIVAKHVNVGTEGERMNFRLLLVYVIEKSENVLKGTLLKKGTSTCILKNRLTYVSKLYASFFAQGSH